MLPPTSDFTSAKPVPSLAAKNMDGLDSIVCVYVCGRETVHAGSEMLINL